MIDVLFFASVREQLGTTRLQVPYSGETDTVNKLIASLVETHGDRYREVLQESKPLKALNQDMISEDAALSDGDELAFFPPVTGG